MRNMILFACILCILGCKVTPPEESVPPPIDQHAPPQPEGLAFPGKPPPQVDPTEVPGPLGPFVEPPLEERPRELHWVVVGHASSLKEAGALMKRASGVAAVPVGYPSVDQARGVLGSSGWVVLAGKFARRAFAHALADALRKAGLKKSTVVSGAYRHDRLSPATNEFEYPKVGVVFAGIADMQVPLLKGPTLDAQGTGKMVTDSSLVAVTAREEVDNRLWYRVEADGGHGFLPASRVFVEYNVFPASNGRWGVLGVSLGCIDGNCRWDYWLVGRSFSPRSLLAPSAQLHHDFSPDGKILAYASSGKPVTLAFENQPANVHLGPGTSPCWSPDGKRLYFRRPGISGHRDEVVVAAAPEWDVRTVLDFRGKPYYPKALSVVPPPVDMRQGGSRLYTMFYRLVKKGGRDELQRWKVLFNPDGKIVDKKGEQISE